MLGWWFIVRVQTPSEWMTSPDRDKYLLATWDTGLSGLDWIENLVANGVAEKLFGTGYPNRYQLRAEPVLQRLHDRMQAAATGNSAPGSWRNATFVAEVISTCPPDAILVVEAWDQS